MARIPRLFVISGPSGAGKGTLLSRVRESRPDLGLTVSATTRSPRPGDVDGVTYLTKRPRKPMPNVGEFARVRITAVQGYDFEAVPL